MDKSVQKVLTENDIKRVTLRFLKGYYKYRPRKGNTEVSADMRGVGGIIADGFLKFKQEDDTDFTATFEATSYDTSHEVRFRRLNTLLAWDGAAFALVATTVFYILGHEFSFLRVRDWTALITLGLLALFGISTFFSYLLLFRHLKRYRYIYAIEQFKQYHADEQWIAIGEDVFPISLDRYYEELKNQCIHNGFGLIVVSITEEPQLLITPSRQELFGAQRQLIQFVSQNELTRRFQSAQYKEWVERFTKSWTGWFSKSGMENLERFRKRYMYQIVIAALSLIIMGGIFWVQSEDQKIEYVSQRVYVDEFAARRSAKELSQEPTTYFIDTPYLYPLPLLTRSNREDIAFDFDPITTIIRPRAETKELPPKTILPIPETIVGEPDIIIRTEENNRLALYDCERFYNFTEPKFILLEGLYEDFEATNQRVGELNGAGLDASGMWLGCFRTESEQYAVFIGLLYNTIDEAGDAIDKVFDAVDAREVALNVRIFEIVPDVRTEQ
ncbi:MAG: hypothetical protein AAF798_07405 [Bacteroidota bacterium]